MRLKRVKKGFSLLKGTHFFLPARKRTLFTYPFFTVYGLACIFSRLKTFLQHKKAT